MRGLQVRAQTLSEYMLVSRQEDIALIKEAYSKAYADKFKLLLAQPSLASASEEQVCDRDSWPTIHTPRPASRLQTSQTLQWIFQPT